MQKSLKLFLVVCFEFARFASSAPETKIEPEVAESSRHFSGKDHQADLAGRSGSGQLREEIVRHFREVFPFLNETEIPNDSIRFVEFPAGNFTGQVDDVGLKEGWGEILWANGTLYGPDNIFYYSAGDKYFGQWRRDLQEGTSMLP